MSGVCRIISVLNICIWIFNSQDCHPSQQNKLFSQHLRMSLYSTNLWLIAHVQTKSWRCHWWVYLTVYPFISPFTCWGNWATCFGQILPYTELSPSFITWPCDSNLWHRLIIGESLQAGFEVTSGYYGSSVGSCQGDAVLSGSKMSDFYAQEIESVVFLFSFISSSFTWGLVLEDQFECVEHSLL